MHTFRLALFATALSATVASALPVSTDNITIADGNVHVLLTPALQLSNPTLYNSLNSGWYGNHEDNETEYLTQSGQQWDLEGMYLSGTTLSLIGGYNFQAGQVANGHNYVSGDIFIDINGDARYGTVANNSSGRGGTVVDNFGYDYVIHFNSGLTAYSVFDLTTGPVTVARATDIASSNPWTYVSGGTAVAGWQNVSSMTVSTLSSTDATSLGLLGYAGNNTHYSLGVNVSFLPSNTLTTFHYTMECGNDALMGRATSATVPDTGATAGLVLAGMLMLGATRRLRIFRARAS